MPFTRRKKKKAMCQLPELTFVQSPDDQPGPLFTPEAVAADNPITAREIPVDQIEDDSIWVSPQFPRTLAQRNLRKLRKRSARLRHKSENGVDACHKFAPLQFISTTLSIGEKTSPNNVSCRRTSFSSEIPQNLQEMSFNDSHCRNSEERLKDGKKQDKDLLDVDVGGEDNDKQSEESHCCNNNVCKQKENHLSTSHRTGTPTHKRTGSDFSKSVSGGIFSTLPSDLPLTPPRSSVVLALDTPECEYGLTHRQRQIKYGLRGMALTSAISNL